MSIWLDGMDGIYFGVTTALKIVQRSTPFLTRHFASRSGGFTPMNNLPHSRSWSDPYYEKTFMKRAQELPESPRITLCQQDPGVWKKGDSLLGLKTESFTGILQKETWRCSRNIITWQSTSKTLEMYLKYFQHATWPETTKSKSSP